MMCGEWLRKAAQELSAAGIETARLDALVLLEDVLGIDRASLLAEPGQEISTVQQAKLDKLLKRRVRHEPLAYVRGHSEFYGRTFVISPAVLVPRPESETMIELFKGLFEDKSLAREGTQKVHVADVGTGSGALGITAALEVPNTHTDLLEIDPEAAKIAKINVAKFTPGIRVVLSDLLASSDQNYDILLCNLPYVPDGYQINQAAAHEPKIALCGGIDGLDIYRALFQQIQSVQKRPLFILTESLPTQHVALTAIAAKNGYAERQNQDFIQLFTPSK